MAMVWCEDVDLLSSMFDFPDEPCSQLDKDENVQGLCRMFTRFTDVLQVNETFPVCECKCFPGRLPEPFIEWMFSIL